MMMMMIQSSVLLWMRDEKPQKSLIFWLSLSLYLLCFKSSHLHSTPHFWLYTNQTNVFVNSLFCINTKYNKQTSCNLHSSSKIHAENYHQHSTRYQRVYFELTFISIFHAKNISLSVSTQLIFIIITPIFFCLLLLNFLLHSQNSLRTAAVWVLWCWCEGQMSVSLLEFLATFHLFFSLNSTVCFFQLFVESFSFPTVLVHIL